MNNKLFFAIVLAISLCFFALVLAKPTITGTTFNNLTPIPASSGTTPVVTQPVATTAGNIVPAASPGASGGKKIIVGDPVFDSSSFISKECANISDCMVSIDKLFIELFKK